jgi:membrane-bound metal-dependent hydrolase YbcI (DUF457 family)
MKAVFAVRCVVAVFLILAFLPCSFYDVVLFLALLLTAAGSVTTVGYLPLLGDSSHRRSPTALKPSHFQEKTHANCFDSQLGS